jgi:hypothetical protein
MASTDLDSLSAKLLSDTKDTMQESAAESPTIPPPELRKTFKLTPKSDRKNSTLM